MKHEVIPQGTAALSVVDTRPSEISSEPRLTKIEWVARRLHELALELGPGARLPRIQELCARFEVSITTLTSALDQLTASGVVTRRRGSGIFVAPGVRKANILLLCDAGILGQPELSPFWNLLIQGARARARREALGFELHFVETNYSPNLSGTDATSPVSSAVAGLIKTGRIDGALTIGLQAEATLYLEANGVPVVAFAGPAKYIVLFDIADLVQQGVRALAAAGAKRIGLWSPVYVMQPQPTVMYFQKRQKQVFQETLAELNLPFEESLVHQNTDLVPYVDSMATKSYQQQGLDTGMEVFGEASEDRVALPDAILSTDDMLSAGILAAMRSCGVNYGATVGEGRICIATHANVGSHMLIGDEENLIRLEVDPNQIIETLFFLLETLMVGKTIPDRTHVRSVLKVPGEETGRSGKSPSL